MRGCTGSHGVLQWSLSGSMGSYKGIQYHVRGLAGSQGTDQWSLDGSMGPYDVLGCHKRGYKGFRGAVYWSLNGSRGSYGILQSHTRGCTESADAGQCPMVSEWYKMGLGWNTVPYDGLYNLHLRQKLHL